MLSRDLRPAPLQAVIGAAVLVAAACNSRAVRDSPQQAAQNDERGKIAFRRPSAFGDEAARSRQSEARVVPSGAALVMRTTRALGTSPRLDGELAEPLTVDGNTIVPKGAVIECTVTRPSARQPNVLITVRAIVMRNGTRIPARTHAARVEGTSLPAGTLLSFSLASPLELRD
jgi:hypothetical protein